LKIILKKKQLKKNRGIMLGLTVTKAHSPTTPPTTQIITGKAGNGQKMMSSLPMNGISYAETLRNTVK